MRLQFTCILFSIYAVAIGQVDSLKGGILIDEVTIATEAKNYQLDIIDNDLNNLTTPILATTNLGNFLGTNENIYIKSYGIGSSATMSIRGGSANQTIIKWEGIAINNPMLGLTDLSLIPLASFSNLSITKGGSCAKEGSGGITGILNLENDLSKINEKINLSLETGSFGTYGSKLKFRKTLGKFNVDASMQIQSAENDFPYSISSNKIEKTNSNAVFKNKSVILNIGYRLKDTDYITIKSWYQNTNRNIPPLTTQNTSEASQDDYLNRIALSWDRTNSASSYHTKFAYFNETNNYQDPIINLISSNKFEKFFHSSTFRFLAQSRSIEGRYEYTHTIGRSDFYQDNKQAINQISAFLNYTEFIDKYAFKLDLHKQWNSLQNPSLIPAFRIESKYDRLNFLIKLSKEYRVPTLNELFWTPGGSPLLKAENGWNQEMSLSYTDSKILTNTLTIFNRQINDWILWYPAEGDLTWSAANLSKVKSYGIDYGFKIKFDLVGFSNQINTNYAYTVSKNIVAIKIPKIDAGDQLIYTPLHSISLNLQSNYKTGFVNIRTRQYSKSEGINEDVEGYNITDLALGITFNSNELKQQIQFNLNNLFNTSYRIIERRPMPGRSFYLSWSLTI